MTTNKIIKAKSGRPRLNFDLTYAQSLLLSGVRVEDIANTVGVSRSTMYRRTKEWREGGFFYA